MSQDQTSQFVDHRYLLRRRLGRGGMGEVFQAFDRLTGEDLALKRVRLPDEDSLVESSSANSMDYRLALAVEFQTLASLRHPHIISVLDYGFDEQRQPYYTMQLLQNSRNLIEAGRSLSLAQKMRLIVQLFQALAYLHRRGIFHRDLKPDNVQVIEDQVKVLDFGLAVQRDMRAQQGIVGTLAYMAPELLRGAQASAATDLYAAGMLAIELIAGRHPFNVENVSELVQQIYSQPVDTLSLDIPESLAYVLANTVHKDPFVRYQNTQGVLAYLIEHTDMAQVIETSATRESFLQAARFTGRQVELQQLMDALTAAEQGQGATWLVAGESGVGKSRLVDELRMRALVQGARVVRGQSVQNGGSLYHAWRPVVRRLALFTRITDDEAAILKLLIPDLDNLLGRELSATPVLTPQQTLERLQTLIETLLRRQERPLVVVLEDLQWGRESVDLLARVAPLTETMPVLLVGSFRDDERSDLPRMVPGSHLLKLDRLNADEIAQLSISMLGEQIGQQEAVLDLLERESEGNVFFIVEVVRALAEETGRLDMIGTKTLPPAVFAQGMQTIIHRRLARVPAEDRPLLQIAAVAGRYLDLSVLAHLAPDMDLSRWLITCADAAVLDVAEGRWRFAHDKLRDGLLEDIDDGMRRVLHRRVARAIEDVYGDSAEHYSRLAFYWGQAGSAANESDYAALAASQMALAGLNLEAKGLYAQALRAALTLPRTDDRRAQVIEWAIRRAQVALYHPDNSVPHFLDEAYRAAQEGGDSVQSLRVLAAYGAYYFMVGQAEQALTTLQHCIELAESTQQINARLVPYNFIGRALMMMGRFSEAIDMLQQGMALAQRLHEDDLLAGTLAWLSCSEGLLGHEEQAHFHGDRAMQLADSLGHPSRIAGNCAVLATIAAIYGNVDQAERLARRALVLCRKTGDLHPHYAALAAQGRVALLRGNTTAALNLLERGLKLAFEHEVYLFVPLHQAWHAEALAYQGEAERAQRLAENALQLAQKTHQHFSAAEIQRALGVISIHTRPDDPSALAHLQAAVSAFRTMNARPMLVGALLSLVRAYLRQPDERGSAATILAEAQRMLTTINMPFLARQAAEIDRDHLAGI